MFHGYSFGYSFGIIPNLEEQLSEWKNEWMSIVMNEWKNHLRGSFIPVRLLHPPLQKFISWQVEQETDVIA